MDYITLLAGEHEELPVYRDVVQCIESLDAFPFLLEKIFRETASFSEDTLDHFHFALLRLQIYADIHRYENMEQAQKTKYVAEVLEKVIFGALMLEREDLREP